MKLISLNLRFGGQSRTDSILNYINNHQPDLLVLGEYKVDDNGQKIKTTLQQEGFYFDESEDEVLGVLVASKHLFTTTDKNTRWVEIELKENSLKVLGVYVPTGSGDKEFKDAFWQKILNYARENREKNCIITGDFNSCCKEDTMNNTYSEKELMELKSLNWIDSWANFKADASERYTWYSNAGNGFRLDYAFLSPKLSKQIDLTSISHDSKFREEGLSDHSPIHLEFDFKNKLAMNKLNKETINKFRGSLIGLAVGDALGVPLEFQSPGTFEPVTDMIGGGSFDLKPGEWTDDTSTALCLALSLIEKKGFDPIDQLNKYLRWYQVGYLSVNGSCFDIGNTTREALFKYRETGEPFSGPSHERSAGNGSLMRLAPLPLFYNNNPKLAIKLAGDISRTTHQHPLAIDACKYTAGLIIGALNGESKETILSPRYCPIPGYWDENRLETEIDEIACGSYKNKNPPEIKARGFVVRSLEAALWAFYKTDSFAEGCLRVVNLGDDADTVGAIYGQIAGAYYGESGIPEKWIDKLAKYDLISCIADELLKISTDD